MCCHSYGFVDFSMAGDVLLLPLSFRIAVGHSVRCLVNQ